MSPDHQSAKLVYMANQIATFFASRPEEEAIAEITNHLTKFWEPRMRARITAYAAHGDAGLHPRAEAAVKSLNSRSTQ